MHSVTLLSSFHIELGNCNSKELYKIIEEISPEIIFEELPHNIFEIIYEEGETPQSLEAITIKQYLKKHPIKHFPVDTYKINEDNMFDGYDIIASKSAEYTELFKQELSMTSQFGYSFLNSKDFGDQFEKIRNIEENVLLDINDLNLLTRYRSDHEINNRREHKMLQNIYNYSKQFHYDKALFICGAEHRTSIMKKITEYDEKEKFKLNWIFYNGI
jgi:hypothetical protein